jgi:hypothetical protein
VLVDGSERERERQVHACTTQFVLQGYQRLKIQTFSHIFFVETEPIFLLNVHHSLTHFAFQHKSRAAFSLQALATQRLLSRPLGFKLHQQAKQLNMFKTVITLLALFMMAVGVLGADTRGNYSCLM